MKRGCPANAAGVAATLVLGVALALAGSLPAPAQTASDPTGLFVLPGDPGAPAIQSGTATVDDLGQSEELVGLRLRFDKLRAAGFPMPDVDDLDAYGRGTLLTAAQLIRDQSDDCIAAADMAMFLNSRIADTNWGDAIGTVDRPLWMTVKVMATMTLPDPFSTGGSLADQLADYFLKRKTRFGLVGTLYNAVQSVEIVTEHWGDTIAVQHGQWALDAYDKARREDWSAEEVAAEISGLQKQSNDLLSRINYENTIFEGAIVAAKELHTENAARIDAAYKARLAALAEDEATGGERKRREQWLLENAHTGQPKPGMDMVIDPTRNPSEIGYEWAVTETEPGGRYYREERSRAQMELDLARAEARLMHEALLRKIAYDFDRQMEERLNSLARLQVARETLHKMNLAIANGNCQDIAKPDKVKEKMPGLGMEALVALPHDELMSTLEVLRIWPPEDMMSCICVSAGYGQHGTTQLYHPDTIGDYNPLYACNHPGAPCVVSGFGCLRYPLPSNPAFWRACGEGTDVGGMTVPDAIADRLNNGD